ncbi:MAG TPA: transketolase C-terminal domain-containing protein, partial [Acidimicrobiales bacterium]|nr:transketolase C-terminal domain-containing protein [Acidimicrobiales bacterium]
DNHITIDGATELATNDDVAKRFEAYGWHVLDLGEVANDLDVLEAGLRAGMAEAERPSLLILRSHIGWPAPHRTDTKEAHGEVFGEDEIRETKELLGLPPEEFYSPQDVVDFYRAAGRAGRQDRLQWEERRALLEGDDAAAYEACLAGRGLPGWSEKLPVFEPGTNLATRRAINKCVNATAGGLPGLVAGAADLTGNTGVSLEGSQPQSREDPGGNQVHFGIREFGMASALNGMALHGGIIPVGGTFFVFSDYARPAVRLAALSQAHSIFFFTHDSIGLGEDGPTHQPIEQLASLRAMPGLRLIRPADANECAQAWRIAVDADGPTALVMSRQDVPVLDGTAELAPAGVAQGGYVLVHEPASLDVVLIGTGSEVQLCVAAAEELSQSGVGARVVSLPSWDLFEAADPAYKTSVIPAGVPRLAVEAAASFGWDRYADATIAIDRFGASAPWVRNMTEFGFTAENVVAKARLLLSQRGAHGAETKESE